MTDTTNEQLDQAQPEQAAPDTRDAELAALRAEVAALRAKKNPAAALVDEVERIPHLLRLACGHRDVADNAAGSTLHHCTTCDQTVDVTGVSVATPVA